MKYASDFRRIARESLHSNWGIAILTGFVASLIGANITTSGGGSNINLDNFLSSESLEEFVPIILSILAVYFIWSIAVLIICGAGKLGYAKFNLNLIDKKQVCFSDLFSQFNRLGDGFCMELLVGIYTILWSLFFIIPGIVKAYSYAMTPYIILEHPEKTVNESISKSKNMMYGNKWRLFCLEFSFIGWELLAIAPMLVLLPLVFMKTVGIIWLFISLLFALVAGLFLKPYQEAARAAFYRDVAGVAVSNSNFEDDSQTVDMV